MSSMIRNLFFDPIRHHGQDCLTKKMTMSSVY
jgi:hypothetical protein